MCIIIDTNKLDNFLADPADSDSRPIHNWINRGKGRVVYSTGHKFAEELQEKAKAKLKVLSDRGLARLMPDDEVSHVAHKLSLNHQVKSNDTHVLALAKISGARLLYTRDSKLIGDFKNPRLINNPRGKVYSTAKNSRLLTQMVCKD